MVVLMNNALDFAILQQEHWYRIPVSKKAPLIVRDGTVKYLAFYHTKAFKDFPCTIQWYAEVIGITQVTRAQLFPNEPAGHKKAGKNYYKIQVADLKPLPKPIFSHRPRRILFIPTTETKFFGTMQLDYPEINHLYNDSPLEDILFQRLVDARIYPERQFRVDYHRKKYVLDFAIFCKTKNLNVECDGMTYHYATTGQRLSDNDRNNELTSHKWAVLRYPTAELTDNMDNVLHSIKQTVDGYGGVADPKQPEQFYYVSDQRQMRLF